MDIQTTTHTTIALTLTEDEARAILADPKPFQRDLRAALAAEHTPKARSPFGTRPARKTATAGETKDIAECPHCNVRLTKRGLGIHIARVHGARAHDAG